MLHTLTILLVLVLASLTQCIARNIPPNAYAALDKDSTNYQRPQQAEDVRRRRRISNSAKYLNHGRPSKLSVQLNSQELPPEGFSKRQLETLKDMVSLQFCRHFNKEQIEQNDDKTNHPEQFNLRQFPSNLTRELNSVQQFNDREKNLLIYLGKGSTHLRDIMAGYPVVLSPVETWAFISFP